MPVNVTGGSLDFEATISTGDFEGALQRIENQLKQLTQSANNEASAIENVAAKASTAIGAYLSLNAAQNFISQVVNIRGQYEQLSVAFTTMLGNKEKADALMAQAIQLAATTPFSLLDVANGAKQLLAYGTQAGKITDTLKMLGNVASGVSAPLGDIVYLYGTLQTQGRAYTRDILQFTARGIPIIQELAQQFNVSTAEVQNLVEAGKVGFPEIQKAFQDMTGAGGQFFNLMEEQSKTVTGQLSNLGDAFNNMLNEIGKSNQGIIVSSIQGLQTLVQNYQTVIDVIKVLVATYGAYKAAVIATTAYNYIAAESVAGYTLAETLRYRAMIISESAMKLLNATMLANPYVAVATGIAALVAAFVVFNKETTQVKTSQELLADAQKNVGDKFAETEAKIRPYLIALKDANVSESERLNIYNKLKEVDPEIVKNLDAKTLSYAALANNVNKYLDSLRRQISLESNSKAITESIKAEQLLQKQIDELNSPEKALMNKALKSDAIADLSKQLEEQKKVTENLGKSQLDLSANTDAATTAQKRTVDVIDAQITTLKKQQTAVSATSAEWKKYQAQIEALQKERESITGLSTKQLKEQQSGEEKINAILQQRQGILDKISGLQRDSKQSGLLQDASAVDNVRQKYDEALQSISEFNNKIDEFNKRNHTNVKGIGLSDIDALNVAKQTEVLNTIYKQDSDKYLAALNEKKQAFEDFQRIQQEGNSTVTQEAKTAYRQQLGDFNNYLDYLKSEADNLQFFIKIEPDNIGLQKSLLGVNKQITEETNKQNTAAVQQRISDYKNALQDAMTFADKKKQIDDKYNKDALSLASNANDKQIAEHLAALQRSHDQELTDLQNNLLRQSDLYRQLNEDIISFTRAQLKERIDVLKQELKQGFVIDVKTGQKTVLTPQMQADLKSGLDSAQGLYEATDKTVINFDKIAEKANEGETAFRNLASSVQDVNAGLANALNFVADIISGVGKASQSLSDFKKAQDKGDAIGQISAGLGIAGAVVGTVIKVVTGVIKLFKAAKDSAREADAQLLAYQNSLITGEVTYNELLRQRAITQSDITKMTVEQLEAQQRLLVVQQQQAKADESRLLLLIQQQGQQVTGEHEKKYGGILGIARKTKTVQDLAGLSDADYTQLEQLFTEGKLDAKTAAWFQELQKVHDELDSIGQSAQDVADQLDQALTGTTADDITSTIIQGFSDGKFAVADFADDFQTLMKNAILQSLKYNALQQPLQDFYNQFVADTSDNGLTANEITDLQNKYNSIIQNASNQFQQLQSLTNVDFAANGGSSTNSLTGAIKGITEDTAQLFTGQFGGLRISQAQQVSILTESLTYTIRIASNTDYLPTMAAILQNLQSNGIKIR